MSNTRFKMEWRPLVLLMAIGGIVGRATVGQSLSNSWSTIGQLLDNYWVIFEQLLGIKWQGTLAETIGRAGLLSASKRNFRMLSC